MVLFVAEVAFRSMGGPLGSEILKINYNHSNEWRFNIRKVLVIEQSVRAEPSVVTKSLDVRFVLTASVRIPITAQVLFGMVHIAKFILNHPK